MALSDFLLRCCGNVIIICRPLSLTLAISSLQSPFVAPLLRDSWEIVEICPLQCRNLFLHISRVTHTWLLLNCTSTILNNWATVHLAETMKNIFSLSWHQESVCRTVATKSGDGATTSDKWHFVLLRPVAWDSPSGVKGAL